MRRVDPLPQGARRGAHDLADRRPAGPDHRRRPAPLRHLAAHRAAYRL
ncbi:hypothetical protein, partial [Aeromonas caviae]